MKYLFNPGQDIPFGGKSILVCRDLCQLPSVRVKPIFTFNETYVSMDLWIQFRLAEIDQIMRQDDETLVNLPNKIGVNEIDQNI